ncbi:uncharacterized protein A4U43_C04F18700 [Asparagus officinalis]|uniref:Cation/H+ exchanger domain-containing protein n=1 Tax=Asparagus officinalis TaxID=4686 RepID=A0A5P1F6L4_ASPOF|nr:uncharacterized protein A4U43_C04F18700 [Asparagus officinalis]
MAEVAPRESDGIPGEPSDAVVFVGISLVLGIASRHVLRGARVPYTVALLIIGIVMGSLDEEQSDPWVSKALITAGGDSVF